MFLNNRHHDPTTGTFLSVDPLVATTGQAYLYGAGNPVTYSDPTGLSPADACERSGGSGACNRATLDLAQGKNPSGSQTGPPASMPGHENYDDMQLVENWMSGDGGYLNGDYWDPFGMGICIGALACEQAWKHWISNGQDDAALAQAKIVATYYCVVYQGKCGTDETGTMVAMALSEGLSLLGSGIVGAIPRSGAVKPVPDPTPVYKPNGAPNRGSPWYVSYVDANGNIRTIGNQGGVHAEVRIQQMMPGAQMSRPFGWRTVDGSVGPQWVVGTVCTGCQVYPRSLFAPGTEGALNGPWGAG